MKSYEFLNEAEATKSYEIQRKDTLSQLARDNNTTVDAIMDLNRGNKAIRDRDTIYAGGNIQLPEPKSGSDKTYPGPGRRAGSDDVAKPDDVAKIGNQKFPDTPAPNAPGPNDDMGGKDFGVDDPEYEFPTVELGFGDPGYAPLTGKTQVERRPDGNWYYTNNGAMVKPDVARFAEKRFNGLYVVKSKDIGSQKFPMTKAPGDAPPGGPPRVSSKDKNTGTRPTRPDQGRDQSPMPGVKSGSGFGPRNSPTRDGRIVGSTDHQGVDFPAPIGTSVYAPNKAKVISVDRTPLGGLTIVLGNAKGEIIHKFLHLDKSLVKQDEIVEKGQEIAKSGQSGAWTTGPHLHWEKWVDGKPVNPKDYVNLD